jgi:hypothetical protein
MRQMVRVQAGRGSGLAVDDLPTTVIPRRCGCGLPLTSATPGQVDRCWQAFLPSAPDSGAA